MNDVLVKKRLVSNHVLKVHSLVQRGTSSGKCQSEEFCCRVRYMLQYNIKQKEANAEVAIALTTKTSWTASIVFFAEEGRDKPEVDLTT